MPLRHLLYFPIIERHQKRGSGGVGGGKSRRTADPSSWRVTYIYQQNIIYTCTIVIYYFNSRRRRHHVCCAATSGKISFERARARDLLIVSADEAFSENTKIGLLRVRRTCVRHLPSTLRAAYIVIVIIGAAWRWRFLRAWRAREIMVGASAAGTEQRNNCSYIHSYNITICTCVLYSIHRLGRDTLTYYMKPSRLPRNRCKWSRNRVLPENKTTGTRVAWLPVLLVVQCCALRGRI